MTDNEMPPQCRAQLILDGSDPYRCTLGENHAAMHRDQDTWNITYVDEPPAVPVDIRVRPVQDQLTALTVRVGLLETAVLTHPEECRCLPCVMPSAPPTDPEAVLIDPVELGKLLEAQEKLNALEAAGVDNWEGHGHAMQIMRERSNS